MPLDSTRVIHGRWSEHHQTVSTNGMTCRVRIYGPGAGPGTYNPTTGDTTPPADVLEWDCPARFAADLQPGAADLAGQDVAVLRYRFALPAAVGHIVRGRTLVISECAADPLVVGRRFFIDSQTWASERFERDLTCTEMTT